MQLLPILAPVFFLVATIGLVVFVLLYQRKRERERTEQLQLVANQLRWNFAAAAPLNMIAGLDRFVLFNQGRSREIRNMMCGEANGIKAAVFDYIYVTGSGKNRQTHSQSIVYLEPGNLNLPFFSLRPENFFHKFLSAFGYQDIDFGQRPNFSANYILRGQDEQGIRRVFGDNLLSFYESYQGTCTDAGGNQLLLFRGRYRFQPAEVQSYIGLALNLLNLFPRY